MQKITIGDIEIIALQDGTGAFLKLEQTFPTVKATQWPPYYQRYPQSFTDASTWFVHYNCYLVRSPKYNLLVDTGIGPGPAVEGQYGRLLASLEQIDVSPEEINTVFFTHLHVDHVGWNLDAEGLPTFPNARYVLHEAEWDFYQQPMVKASIAPYIDQMVTPLKKLDVLDLLSGGEQPLAKELTAIPTPGHSPGHMSLLISSKNEQCLIGGDAILHPAQVTEHAWCATFDMDNEQTRVTRKRLLDWLERDEIVMAAGHFPGPGFGRIVCQTGRLVWEAL